MTRGQARDTRIALFGVPTSRASHTGGQEKAPAVLRAAGLVGLLNASGFVVDDLGDLPVGRFRPDPSSPRAQNAADVVRTAGEVQALVRRARTAASWPLVIGGDCTIALGALGALAEEGAAPALLYFDAHGDLNIPDAIPYGALDWMGVAHALALDGTVPELAGPRRLLEPDALRLFATVPDQLTAFERDVIARLGVEPVASDEVAADPAGAARRALESLPAGAPAWLHFDVDAIDSMDLPIADFHQLNRGLSFAAACAALGVLAAGTQVAGLSVSQFNPDHTDEGDAERFVRGLVAALAIE
jgi:arginase